ncbi:class I SAM-dependent methyltransferase [Paenibacillus sp. J31TS4]|uniref:class I SAM-dependent DNA methyltransferase n=1 Tax=Paenibacillus sp. J31TS4 TaxID=2807195 RepID=UPI001B17865A|nr:class I SAM-dependent methyltransferase [Paenibacillus sp. J31TS4]GIP41042.1 class I SAM-dependent methyltransferase [Paenibacillus sp. J31TS4]
MAQYDAFAEQYNEMVETGRSEAAYRYVLEQLRPLGLEGMQGCDIGCGQGELAVRLERLGAAMTGVDLSGRLLDYARRKSGGTAWVQDDAMTLASLPDGAYDFSVSCVMLVDVPDHRSVFAAASRILKPGGTFVWIITHPCFQSPFSAPEGDGSRRIREYTPQFWISSGTGTIRSTVGAYHRPLADYVNSFLEAGFTLLRVDEPARPDAAVDRLPLYFGAIGRKPL